jgi:subfamily B ATP-binding cassette protein MsbA
LNVSPVPDSEDRSVFRRFLGYFSAYKTLLFLSLALAIFIGLADSSIALIISLLMDLFGGMSGLSAGGQSGPLHLLKNLAGFNLYDITVSGREGAQKLLIFVSLATLGLFILKGAAHFLKEWMLWRVTNGILTRMKGELFTRIVTLPIGYYDREKSGEVLARVTYDVSQLETAVRAGIQVCKSSVYALIFITAMFFMEWSLTLLAIMLFPLSAIVLKQFGDRMRRTARTLSLNVADYTSFISEATAGIRVIKAFGREADQQNSFAKKIRENFRYSMKIAKYSALHSPTQEIISSIGSAVLIVFCGLRIFSGAMTVGDLSGFLVLLSYAYKPIKDLGETNAVLQRAVASGRRIFNLLDEPDEATTIPAGSLKTPVKGNLAFSATRFSYRSGEEVLKGIDLEIAAGETVALVGPSGGGKSTILNLIPRFYLPDSGDILLDGIDLKEFDIAYLRSLLAIVPQETILFSGTIEDNVRFGRPDATLEEVTSAARSANALEFIEKLPEGFASQVGERGAQLSGGQRQRIAVARAILRDPRILLLDEATSALDSQSEKLVQEALDRLRRNRTTLIIAHRLSTVQTADRIAVVSGGQIVEVGSHSELYAKGGLYRTLCNQQFGI